MENNSSQHTEVTGGTQIDNGINRGTSYTDASGADYNLRYIPIRITNDSLLPVHVQIAFSAAYEYTMAQDTEAFKIIPLPQEWALDGVEDTESMMDELAGYIEKPSLDTTIQAGETFMLAIGTLYPRPSELSGILPRALFIHSDSSMFPTCDWRMKKAPAPHPPPALGLRLVFGGNCMIIPCGQIAYLDP